MRHRYHSARCAALLLSVLALPGCAGTGILNDSPDGLGRSRVSGEVRSVDTREREIHLRTNRGRNETVVFDRNTRVVQGQRRFSVGDLERGDEVSMQIQRDRRGLLYTDLIRVERSVRDHRDGRARDERRDRDRDRDRDRGRDRDDRRTQTFEGQVVRIDHGQGWFELRENRRSSYRVTLPYRPGSSITDRFRRLRRGDHVRFSGQLLNRERIELQRFR